MKAYKTEPDVYAMQGYDAAQLLIVGMNAVKGDTSKRAELVEAMASAKLDSPRGPLSFTKSHNPIHDIYLRKVEGKENKYVERGGQAADRSAARLQDVGSLPGPRSRMRRDELGAVQGARPKASRKYGEGAQRRSAPNSPRPSGLLPRSAPASSRGWRIFPIFAAPRASRPSLLGPATHT